MKKEDKMPIGVAVDILLKRRDRLLEDYAFNIINISQSYNIDRDQQLYSDLNKINNEVKFVARLLSLLRNQINVPLDENEVKNDKEHNPS